MDLPLKEGVVGKDDEGWSFDLSLFPLCQCEKVVMVEQHPDALSLPLLPQASLVLAVEVVDSGEEM